jgi:hypothetical protein
LIDIDRPGAADAWQDANLPPPTWICINRENGHAHLAYALEKPIFRAENQDLAAKLFKDARRALQVQLKADLSYSGTFTKSPWCDEWIVECYGHSYDLSFLWSEWITEEAKRCAQTLGQAKQVRERGAQGRNASLFEAIRLHCQRHWATIASMSHTGATAWVLEVATAFNQSMFPNRPLPASELRAMACSVALFMKRKFDPRKYAASFSQRQRKRQERSARKRRGATEAQLRVAAGALREAGEPVTVARLAKICGISTQAIYKSHKGLAKMLSTPHPSGVMSQLSACM